MPQQNKLSIRPGVTGAFMSLLLIVSFFLPRIWEGNSTVGSVNTLLIVVIMFIAVRLVRETSELFGEHLWDNKMFLVLMSVPVFNLITVAVQFVVPDASFMLHPVFLTLLVVLSLPVFCCCYFTVMRFRFRGDRRLAITSAIIDCVGLIYILIRLADKAIIPALSQQGNDIADILDSLVSFSPWFSLLIYLLSFACFIICAKVFSETDGKTE